MRKNGRNMREYFVRIIYEHMMCTYLFIYIIVYTYASTESCSLSLYTTTTLVRANISHNCVVFTCTNQQKHQQCYGCTFTGPEIDPRVADRREVNFPESLETLNLGSNFNQAIDAWRSGGLTVQLPGASGVACCWWWFLGASQD